MRAHGIAGNGNNGNSAGAGGSTASSVHGSPGSPATSKAPANSRKAPSNGRKAPSNGRKPLPDRCPSPTSKKRKLAAQGDDGDDEDIKPEIKNEVKQEPQWKTPESDGSYTTNPRGAPLEASAAAMHVNVNVSGDAYGENTEGASDEVVLVSECRRGAEPGGPAAPVAFSVQQMLTTPAPTPPPPPSQESFYGFVSPVAAPLHRASQQAIAVTPMPIRYEHDANYPTQMIPLVSSSELGAHWLHHPDPAFFWSEAARLETPPDHADHI